MRKAAEFMLLRHGEGKGFSDARRKELEEFARQYSEVVEFADEWKAFK